MCNSMILCIILVNALPIAASSDAATKSYDMNFPALTDSHDGIHSTHSSTTGVSFIQLQSDTTAKNKPSSQNSVFLDRKDGLICIKPAQPHDAGAKSVHSSEEERTIKALRALKAKTQRKAIEIENNLNVSNGGSCANNMHMVAADDGSTNLPVNDGQNETQQQQKQPLYKIETVRDADGYVFLTADI